MLQRLYCCRPSVFAYRKKGRARASLAGSTGMHPAETASKNRRLDIESPLGQKQNLRKDQTKRVTEHVLLCARGLNQRQEAAVNRNLRTSAWSLLEVVFATLHAIIGIPCTRSVAEYLALCCGKKRRNMHALRMISMITGKQLSKVVL